MSGLGNESSCRTTTAVRTAAAFVSDAHSKPLACRDKIFLRFASQPAPRRRYGWLNRQKRLPAGGLTMSVLVGPSSCTPLVTLLQFAELTLVVFCCSVQSGEGEGHANATVFVAVRKTEGVGALDLGQDLGRKNRDLPGKSFLTISGLRPRIHRRSSGPRASGASR